MRTSVRNQERCAYREDGVEFSAAKTLDGGRVVYDVVGIPGARESDIDNPYMSWLSSRAKDEARRTKAAARVLT